MCAHLAGDIAKFDVLPLGVAARDVGCLALGEVAGAHEDAHGFADGVAGGDGLFHPGVVRAPEKATAAWEASSQPAVSLASVNAPGRRE